MSVPSPTHSPVSDAAEARIRALLAEEKWRQARDELKPLAKEDRPRFLPLLIEANIGLARKMAGNRQTSDARQVLNYLKTIMPAAQFHALELELAATSGVSEPLVQQQVLASLADAQSPITNLDRVRLADALILSFSTSLSGQPSRPAEAKVLEEMRAIHQALEAVSLARWPQVAEALRPVSLRSVFGHWGIFVKGLAAYHCGDLDRAVKLWTALPSNSVPTKASRPYLQLVKRTTEPIPADALVGIFRIVGIAGAGDALTRAEQLWQKGKPVESYRQMRDHVASFPSADLDWIGSLTEFYFNAPHGMAEKDWRDVAGFLYELGRQGRLKNHVEARLSARALSLLGRTIAPPEDLRETWEDFLRERAAAFGPNAQFTSLGYEWLGEQLSQSQLSGRFSPARSRLLDAEGAVTALRKSIELDPRNLGAHLKLCVLYETLNQTRERNRLLDQMTAQFPEEQKVLVAAARGCLERKALSKALDYLTRARRHDQLDPQIPELTVTALQALARDQFQQRRSDKARLTLARCEEFLIDDPKNFVRSRWSASARLAAMEEFWGDTARAGELLAQARRQTPHPVAPLLLAHLSYRKIADTFDGKSPFLADLRPALRKGLRLSDLSLPVRLLEEARVELGPHGLHHEDKWISQAMTGASPDTFTRAHATELIECAANHPDYRKPLLQVVKKLLRTDPKEPLFRLWQLLFRPPGDFHLLSDGLKLEDIIEEASRRQDAVALRLARQMHSELNDARSLDPFEVDEDDGDSDDDDFEPEGPVPVLPPKTLDDLSEVVEMLQSAVKSPSALREVRKKLRGKLPDIILDGLIEMAKSGELPPLPQPSRPKPGKNLPPIDPNQGELF